MIRHPERVKANLLGELRHLSQFTEAQCLAVYRRLIIGKDQTKFHLSPCNALSHRLPFLEAFRRQRTQDPNLDSPFQPLEESLMVHQQS
jgi:hypothetical protein